MDLISGLRYEAQKRKEEAERKAKEEAETATAAAPAPTDPPEATEGGPGADGAS